MSLRERRYNKLFKLLREDIYNIFCKIDIDEKVKGESDYTTAVQLYYAALIYMMMIYNDITNPYNKLLTWEEYKEKYNFEEVVNCFRCLGCVDINLVELQKKFDFQSIVTNGGVDSELMVNIMPDTISINSNC